MEEIKTHEDLRGTIVKVALMDGRVVESVVVGADPDKGITLVDTKDQREIFCINKVRELRCSDNLSDGYQQAYNWAVRHIINGNLDAARGNTVGRKDVEKYKSGTSIQPCAFK